MKSSFLLCRMPGLCGKAFVWLCRSDDFIRSPLCVERKMGWLLSVSIDSFTECNGILCTIYLYNLVYFVIKRRVEKISHSNPSRFHFVCCETVFVAAATATPLHNTNKLETHISKVWFSRWTLHSRKWHDIDGTSAKKNNRMHDGREAKGRERKNISNVNSD